jgi:hypothetical protein
MVMLIALLLQKKKYACCTQLFENFLKSWHIILKDAAFDSGGGKQ